MQTTIKIRRKTPSDIRKLVDVLIAWGYQIQTVVYSDTVEDGFVIINAPLTQEQHEKVLAWNYKKIRPPNATTPSL